MKKVNLRELSGILSLFKNIKIKRAYKYVLVVALCLIVSTTNAYALFENLTQSGSEIFEGLKGIIFAVTGFGIVGIAVGSFFGSVNWKWLSAIMIGLMIIAGTAGLLKFIGGDDAASSIAIQDSLANAN